jgi:hypothetical protein
MSGKGWVAGNGRWTWRPAEPRAWDGCCQAGAERARSGRPAPSDWPPRTDVGCQQPTQPATRSLDLTTRRSYSAVQLAAVTKEHLTCQRARIEICLDPSSPYASIFSSAYPSQNCTNGPTHARALDRSLLSFWQIKAKCHNS